MKKNILFLGVGSDQLIAIKHALELGLGVYGLDGNENAIGKEFCDVFEQCNIKDKDEVELKALTLNKKYGIDGVMAAAVDVGPSVGRIVDKLGLIGIGEDLAEIFTNKSLRNDFLYMHKFNIPKTMNVHLNKTKWNIFPCIIKPKDQAGAVGIKIIYNKEDLSKEKYDVCQEYLEGWELSVEVLVKDSKFIYCIADRNYKDKLKWKPAVIEDGCSLPSNINQNIKDKVGNIISKLISEFKITNGALKLDLLVKDNLIYIIEVAPRMGGGKLSSEMITLHIENDFEWWYESLLLAMGIEHVIFDNKEIVGKVPVAQRYIIPEKVTSHKDRLGDFICTGNTIKEAIRACEIQVGNYWVSQEGWLV